MSALHMEPEEWRPVVGFPEYSVSSLGRVRRKGVIHGGQGSIRTPQPFLTLQRQSEGYLRVTLSVGNKPTTKLVHRLVAEAFLGAPPPGKDCVCHRDDVRTHNAASNLFWGDRSDNMADMRSKNRQARGQLVRSAKLTDQAVAEIRRQLAAGKAQREIAKAFGTSQSTISHIASGATWRHV